MVDMGEVMDPDLGVAAEETEVEMVPDPDPEATETEAVDNLDLLPELMAGAPPIRVAAVAVDPAIVEGPNPKMTIVRPPPGEGIRMRTTTSGVALHLSTKCRNWVAPSPPRKRRKTNAPSRKMTTAYRQRHPIL